FNTPAIVSGIGEGIKPFPLKKQYYILLAKPRSGVSTKEAYDRLDMGKCDHPDIMKLKKALENGESIHGLLGNSLEEPALLLNDDIRRVKQKLQSYEAGEVLMSGSGSTVFCISDNERDILNIYEDMKGNDVYLRFTKTLNF
ncbi:MAG: 4-(cytidine 5'-diphospho)-2-C-methyl-D-erythritol kinase, partial [Erysipelotrichaceae bacterium]|nr:4-(cytidine 5'-diphospho)-2-C-methyl-D-erythritol kinase [Erysipelotrichaceae bacterium]